MQPNQEPEQPPVPQENPLNPAPITSEPAVMPEPMASVTPPQPAPKKKRTFLIILLIILGVVVLGAAAYFVYTAMNPIKTSTTTETTDDTANDSPLLAANVVEGIKQKLTGTLNENGEGADGSIIPAYSVQPYKPSGYDFSVIALKTAGIVSTGTKSLIATDLGTIDTALTGLDFKKTVVQAGDEQAVYFASYISDLSVCAVYDQKPYQPTATDIRYAVTLGCADIADYTEQAEVLKPYYTAFKAVDSTTDTSKIFLSNLKVTASKTADYSTATLGIGTTDFAGTGGFAGKFYQTPDKTWHYFKGTQGPLTCSAYNTDDIKKAFLGETCYLEDGTTASTVKL